MQNYSAIHILLVLAMIVAIALILASPWGRKAYSWAQHHPFAWFGIGAMTIGVIGNLLLASHG